MAANDCALLSFIPVGGKRTTEWRRIDSALPLSFVCGRSGEDLRTIQLKMPYQSEDWCVMHGFQFLNEVNDDGAFDLSNWDKDDKSISYFIPMIIEDQNELNIFCLHPIPTAYSPV